MGSCCTAPDLNDQRLNQTLSEDAKKDRNQKKLLLLGPGNSGKSTFFKQLLRIHKDGFNNEKHYNRTDVTRSIFDCVITQMQAIIRQCEDFEYPLDEVIQESANFILKLAREREIDEIVADHIKMLWRDQYILDSFEHRTNLGIVDSCPHFFTSIDRISRADYIPSEQDILLVRQTTSGIHSERFEINGHRFEVFDVGGQRNERNKWIHCFESVTAVLFVASLSCYDQALFETDFINGMQESLNLFAEVVNSRWFKRTAMILFLNKADLFRIKIEKKDLRMCFPDFDGGKDFKAGVEYIKKQFMKRNESAGKAGGRQIYAHVTCATDTDSVRQVFNDVQHIVVNKALVGGGLL